MNNVMRRGGVAIGGSFIIALMLTMLPLPSWAEHFRPEWVALVLIYWVMALPTRIGVGSAWLAGLLLDVVRGTVMGQYALALSVVAFLVIHLHQRIRVYPLSQQAIVVLILLTLELLLVLWIKGFLGTPVDGWSHWLPAVSSALLWPWVFLLLRDLRRHFQVN